MFFRTNNVSDFHHVVIHYNGKVIYRDTIGFYDYKVTYTIGLEGYMTTNHIIECIGFIQRYAKTYIWFSTFCTIFFFFFFCSIRARASSCASGPLVSKENMPNACSMELSMSP